MPRPIPPFGVPIASAGEMSSGASPVRGTDPALRGRTLLMVEDSRYTCDALRLMCQRLGIRVRRAETLRAAALHLAGYDPDVMVVDLGLPDGRGEDLIRAVATGRAPRPRLIATSGDPAGEDRAMAAGADGFLPKPLPSLAELSVMLGGQTVGGETDVATPVRPADPAALRDDLHHARALLAEPAPLPDQGAYVAGFLRGLALMTDDPHLYPAQTDDAPATSRLCQIIADRIALQFPVI